jgi:hypothetical protein
MNRTALVPIILIGAGLVVALFNPIGLWGENIRPGLGDLLNGSASFMLVMAAGLWAVLARKRSN